MAENFQRLVEIMYRATDDGATSEAKSQANALDGVSKKNKETSKTNDALSKTFKNLTGAIAATVTAGKALAFANESIDLFKEQEQANQLVAVSFGDAAGSIHAYASALQESAKIGDETTLMFAGMLKNMGLTQDQIEKTITASADLVGGSGGLISMETAVRNLAKTYSGMAGELGESVPALRELTKEQLQAGLGVEIVAEQYKGLAAEIAKTDSGKIKGLTNTIGDLKEEIGAQLIPAQVSWLETQRSVIELVRDMSPVLRGAAGSVSALAGVVETIADNKVATGMAAAAGAIYGLNAAVAAGTLSWTSFNAVIAANPIGLATIAVGGLIAAINKLTGDFDEVIEQQGEFIDASAKTKSKVLSDLEAVSSGYTSWASLTRAQQDELKRLEKSIEDVTGMTVKYNRETKEAELVTKSFMGFGGGAATTMKDLEIAIKAKGIQDEKAADRAKKHKEELEKKAKAIEAAAEAEKRMAEAAKERARAQAAGDELAAQLAEDTYLRSKTARDRELAELSIDLKKKEKILLDGGQTAADAERLIEENKTARLREIKTRWATEDAKIEEDRLRLKEEEARKQEEAAERAIELERQKFNTIADIARTAAGSISNVMDAVTDKREKNLDRETKKQIDAVKKSTLSEEEKAKRIEKIEKNAANKRYAIETAEWRNNLVMSVANTALAVTKTLASVPFPASVPLASAAGAAGAVETGIIASNKPQRMNAGGDLRGGSTTTDSVPFFGNPGEKVIDKPRTRKLNAAIDSGQLGGGDTIFNVTVPIEVHDTATPDTARAFLDMSDMMVDRLVRGLEIAVEQNKIDLTRFRGAFA